MADLGFKKLSVEPVVAPPEAPYSIREEDLPQIMEEYDQLAKELIEREKEGRGFKFFHFMLDLSGDRAWQSVFLAAAPERNIWL